MNRTPNRNDLLSQNRTQFGVGYVYDAYGGAFIVGFACLG